MTLFNDIFQKEREVATLEAELQLARERVNWWAIFIEERRHSLSVAKLKLADLKEESPTNGSYKRLKMRNPLDEMQEMIKAIAFDLDGTLVESWTSRWLPGVLEKLQELAGADISKPQEIVIVTNQGGPACREHFNDWQYPTLEEVVDRIEDLRRELYNLGIDPYIFVSLAYKLKDGTMIVPQGIPPQGLRRTWYNELSHWRKPETGMLYRFAEMKPCWPNQILMVGDMESDRQLAQNFGCKFRWAWKFFGWPPPEKINLEDRRSKTG